MNPQKASEIWFDVERYRLKEVSRYSMTRSAKVSTEKKGCDKFDTFPTISQTDVESLHAGRESEGHVSWYTAHCVCQSSHIFAYLDTESSFERQQEFR